MSPQIRAFIWDVDGTLAETEEAHRLSFNEAFAAAGLGWDWDRAAYRRLLLTTGGKERIRAHANAVGLALADEQIRALHADKTRRYTRMVAEGRVALRPGVTEMIAKGRAAGIAQAIATTTSRPNIDALVEAAFAQPADRVFDVIAAGDEVITKKPAPDVYLLALSRLELAAADCIAFEDSRPGAASARAAGLRIVLTPSAYTEGDDFGAVDWMIAGLDAPLPLDLARQLGCSV
ncbi:HAD-IA family hydrolase [Paracoccus cavernae]|uniref:HAD-IA family hydrolase n=1 Tax=Paracoccus cavernae TaxID=1571207 RepID=UPI0035F37B96